MRFQTAARQAVIAGCLIALCSGFLGCGLQTAKKSAEAVVARHFQTVATNGFDEAMADYSKDFFARTSQNKLRAKLDNVRSRLGAYEQCTVISWRVFGTASTTGSGTRVELGCQTRYAKFPAKEIFVLSKPTGDKEYKIIEHSISSKGLSNE